MNQLTVKCPQCQCEVSIDDALRHQIQDQLKKELSSDHEAEIKKIREQAVAWQDEQKQKFEAQKKELADQAKLEVENESKLLKQELVEKEAKLKLAQEQEMKLLKEKKDFETQKAEFELEKARQMEEEREKIKADTAKMLLEQYQFKDKQKDAKIDEMTRKIEELQIKAHQGSQQSQGEILELELEQVLGREFVYDEILPVPKGVNGADVIQKVRNSAGQECGVIVWESKRTKAWSEGWVQKLKDDQRVAKADVAVLITTVMPNSMSNFGHKDGIYVTNYDCLLPVAKFLRLSLIQLCAAKVSGVGKGEKMEMIYDYLSGQEFKSRVEAIVEAFSAMKKDLDDEKRVFVKLWAKREKEIDRVINNTIGMHGDLEGIMGQNLISISNLEMSGLLDEPEKEIVN